MYRLFATLSVALFLMVLPHSEARAAGEGESFDPVHHVSDGYYLDFQPIGRVELPRIFIVRRDGQLTVDFFTNSSSALHSGKYRAIGSGGSGEDAGVKTPADPHEVPTHTPELANPAAHAEPAVAGATHLETSIEPVDGELVLDLSITRHLVFAMFIAVAVSVMAIRMASRYKKGIGSRSAPKGLGQNAFETLVLFIRDEIARPTIGEAKYRKYLPYLLTAFFFIFFCNLIGLVPFSATATSNLMITAVLALFTFFITQFGASKDYWKHIFWPPGVPVAIKPILIPVEILSIFTKPFALAIRLFANMTAGHLVIMSLLGLIFTMNMLFGPTAGYAVSPVSIAFTLFIYFLELLVATIQAYIFTMLSGLFIGMAVAEHEHAHEPSGAAH